MATQFTDELQAEAPPPKRARLEHSGDMQGTTIDMAEDNYRTAANPAAAEALKASHTELPRTVAAESPAINMKGIPGLGLLGQGPRYEQGSAAGGKAV